MTGAGKEKISSQEKSSCDVGEMLSRQNRELIVQQKQLLAAADQLEMLNEKLKASNQMKSDFVSMVVHEIRNPLASVSQSIEVARDLGGSSLPEKTRKYLDVAQRNVWRLNRILQDLLDLARMEAGKLAVELDAADPADLVAEAVSYNQGDAEQARVLMSVEGEVHQPVLADANRVVQIIGNFLSNAIKHTPQGGKITVSTSMDGGLVSFAVSDTGKGIAKEFHQAIFEKYGQLASWQGGGKKGTGLGLPICKTLASLHNSSIEVQSEPGKGARFSFALAPYTLDGRLGAISGQMRRIPPVAAWFLPAGRDWKETHASLRRMLGEGEWQVADPARGRMWVFSAYPESTKRLLEEPHSAGDIPPPEGQVEISANAGVAEILGLIDVD